jgi:hypothetical protein
LDQEELADLKRHAAATARDLVDKIFLSLDVNGTLRESRAEQIERERERCQRKEKGRQRKCERFFP